jgi:N4-gp56 family major capsid protein
MTIDNFTPALWTGKLLANLNGNQVYTNCFNRDYEGEIKNQGDVVKINSIGRVTVAAYVKNTTPLAVQILQDSQMTLAITQADSFCFGIDDVDKAQSSIDAMNAAMKESAWGMADTTDLWLAALLYAGVATASVLTPATLGTGATNADAYEVMVDLDVRLTANNVPRAERWCVIPPWYEGLLRKDPRFVSFGTSDNKSQLLGEPIGKAAGFQIWVSNNVPMVSTAYAVMVGAKQAATYASQLEKVEAFRPQLGFQDAMKGLHLYGAKVTRPYALASILATPA